MPAPDFNAANEATTHDTVLLEWTARTPGAAAYDGPGPRELFRLRQPFANHNGGYLAFNPNTTAGGADFGMLYVGVADGGSGGDPLNMSQNLGSAFGKIFRIDPLGSNSRNKKYGIPTDNPFVGAAGALGEIYAYGVRNPQRFAWDSRNGNLFVADIGQNIVEEISQVTRGGNLGWNAWEGSFRYISRNEVDLKNQRGDTSGLSDCRGQVDHYCSRNPRRVAWLFIAATRFPASNLLILRILSGDLLRAPIGCPAAAIRFAGFATYTGAGGDASCDPGEEQAQKTPATGRPEAQHWAGQRIFLLNKGDGTIRVLAR
jgi:hypothetical protein